MFTPILQEMGYEMVRVQVTGAHNPTLQVMAERLDGAPMTVDDCAGISRALSDLLETEDPFDDAYALEVSSPGIDRPLTRAKDYSRWAGHMARLETAEPVDGRRRFKGTLLGLEGDVVRIRLEDGQETGVPLSAVTRAKLEMTDALIEEHQRAQQGAEQAH